MPEQLLPDDPKMETIKSIETECHTDDRKTPFFFDELGTKISWYPLTNISDTKDFMKRKIGNAGNITLVKLLFSVLF